MSCARVVWAAGLRGSKFSFMAGCEFDRQFGMAVC